MVGVGFERGFVPDLRILEVAELAVGVADVIGDVGMRVAAERMHGGDAALIIAGEDQLPGGAIVTQKFRVGLLLLLLLDKAAVLFFLLAVVRRRRVVGAHGVHGDRLETDGGRKQCGGGENADAAKCLREDHAETFLTGILARLDTTTKWKVSQPAFRVSSR